MIDVATFVPCASWYGSVEEGVDGSDRKGQSGLSITIRAAAERAPFTVSSRIRAGRSPQGPGHCSE